MENFNPQKDVSHTSGTYLTPSPEPVTPTPPAKRGKRIGFITLLLIALLLVFGIGLFAGRTSVAGTSTTLNSTPTANTTIPSLDSNSIESVREAVVSKVRPEVVQINVRTNQGAGLGSGVIIDKRGYIITNNHVVQGATAVQVVLFDGSALPGRVVGTAPNDDLAVVQIDASKANLAVATLGDSSKLRVGQEVLAIGNPLGITQTVTSGIISALERNVSTGQNGGVLPNTIQTDAAINPGNSGGALVDLKGNLIGVPTLTAIDPEFKTPANGVGFAISSNRVKLIAPQLIDNGRVINSGRAVLGIQGANVDSVLAQQNNLPVNQGILIAQLSPDSPAAKAGLKVGDIIVQVDTTAVANTSSLIEVLLSKSPGNTVTIQFYRGPQQQTAKVTLGELQEG